MKITRSVILFFSSFFILTTSLFSQSFISTWKTDNPGTSSNTSITIPTAGAGYNYDVDWNNDGVFDQFGITGSVTHDFGSTGTYTIRIQGTFPRIHFADGGDKLKILSVDQWGNNVWGSMYEAFFGCANLNIVASNAPNLSSVTSTWKMFMGCSSLNANLDNWNVSSISNPSYMFYGCSAFNGDISSWNTISFTTLQYMFLGCTSFNQDIGGWNTSNVTDMGNVFNGASSFNQDIGGWNTSNVSNMVAMFQNASSFNQDISSWDVSNVFAFNNMFSGASTFNQDIGGWNTSSGLWMQYMFSFASNFNQNLGNWDVSSVTIMNWMLSWSGMSVSNYDSTLIGWESQAVQNNITLGADNLGYCDAEPERLALITDHNWTIVGDALQCPCAGDPNGIVTWDGSHGDEWADCRNWTPEVVPTSSSIVVVPTGNDVIIYVGTTANCYDIEMQGSSTLTIQDDVSTMLQIHKP